MIKYDTLGRRIKFGKKILNPTGGALMTQADVVKACRELRKA